MLKFPDQSFKGAAVRLHLARDHDQPARDVNQQMVQPA